MRIAQVSPLFESVPPRLYGGTERVVSFLTEELVRLGHDVTLFASGDSHTAAKLVPGWPESLRLSNRNADPVAAHLLMLEKVFARADEFEIIHFHSDLLHLSYLRRQNAPAVTTVHGRLDLPYVQPFYREFHEFPLISISNDQRQPLPWACWEATVYHGLPEDLFEFSPQHGDYLVFTGRIAPEKRPDLAIEIARRVQMPLCIAAKVSDQDREYFETAIRPLLKGHDVEFIGEVNEQQKGELLGGALAMLFPIDWPEPFGLVMIEAMACGTPTIAFRRGSVPEVIDDGRSGFIVDDVEQAVRAIDAARNLDRRGCRDCFERRFTASRMTQGYLDVYSRQAGKTAQHTDAAQRIAPRRAEHHEAVHGG